ncbi:MAG: hypothetical protein RSO15_15440 [Bacteroides sp.]|uniref:hypothetical protein n=1 Tax=Bacteroides sp. TaxID=29523 RepID=UPI002FC6BADD
MILRYWYHLILSDCWGKMGHIVGQNEASYSITYGQIASTFAFEADFPLFSLAGFSPIRTE